MNFVYKLIFNVSTGTWAVAHELAAARGKKNRTHLAKAMALSLVLPAGAAMAADSPEVLQCALGQTASHDGLRCEATTKAVDGITPRIGIGSVTLGSASAEAQNAVAIAAGANASDGEAIAIGFNSKSSGLTGVAIGSRASVASKWGVSVGAFASVQDDALEGTAIGPSARVTAAHAVALGGLSEANVYNTVSVGNATNKRRIMNVGAGTDDTDAVNVSQLKSKANVSQLESKANASDFASNSLGTIAASAKGNNAYAIGISAKAEGEASVAIGASALASGFHSTAVGAESKTVAGETGQTALGDRAASGAANTTALGATASAKAKGSVALGFGSVADAVDTVSIGNGASKRRLVNMAAGTSDTDAVNIAQLKPLVAGLGGGATIDAKTGLVTGPKYKVDGKQQTSLGDALSSLDAGTTALKDTLVTSGVVAADGKAIAAVSYDRDLKGVTNFGSVTLGNGNGTVKLKNIAAGTDGSDAVNLNQLKTAVENNYVAGKGGGVAAKASGFNSLALGINSVADEANTVSVGAKGAQRRITNLASAQEESDAATYGQVTALVGNATSTTQRALKDVDSRLAALSERSVRAGVDDTFLKIDAPEGSDAAYVDLNNSAVAVGASSSSIGSAAAAIGAASSAEGSQAAAIGGGSFAKGQGALAMGSARAEGNNTTALGNGARSTGSFSLAAGANARSAGMNAVSLGNSTRANSDNSVAIGTLANIDVTAVNSMAIGRNASVGAGATNAMSLGNNTTNTRANTVSVGSLNSERQITNVAAATADTDAVNLSQLKTMVGASGGGPLAVSYTDETKAGLALAGENGTTISNVKAGAVSATSTDAINGAQLQGNAASVAAALGGGSTVKTDGTIAAPSYTVGGNKHTSVGGALGAVDTSLSSLDGRTNDLAEKLAGTGLVDDKGNAIAAVTYDQKKDGSADYASVTLGASGTAVKLSNVAAGAVTATSTDAINGAQLQGNAASVAAALGGGSTVKTDGTIAAPSYTVGGNKHTSVGGALGAVDTSLSSLDGRTNDLAEKLAGTGLVDDKGNAIAAVTYDQKKDGSADYASVTLGASGTAVKLSNVAAGAVTATSTDAINGAQLRGNAASVAAALGGGSTVKTDGTIAAPSYTVGNVKHGDVGSAFGAVNTSLTDLDGRAKQLDEKIANSGLVDDKGNALTAVVYGQNADGSTNYGSVTLGNAAGSAPVRLKNLAAGVDATDAVNVGQLTAATTNPWFSGKGGGTAAKANGFGSVAIGINSVADGNNVVSVGSANLQRRITNVAGGEDDNDAATYGQLVSMVSNQSTRTQSALKDVSTRVAALDARGTVDDSFLKIDAPEGSEAAVVDLNNSAVAIGASSSAIGSTATAIGATAHAQGSQAAAIGGNSFAEGQGALAMGSARAEGNNTTALGNGARSTGSFSLAAGSNARSAGMNAVALGNSTRANSDNAVAIGTLANIDATAINSMAIGRNASVGAGATNAMSLGSNTTNTRANTVSVGSLNNERQITNVAAGTAETDAVNFSQLKKYVGENGGSGGAANPLAVAYTDSDKGTVSLGGTDGTTLSNVKAGTADTDAANIAQVKGVASAIGGGAAVAADGTITAPSFSIGGKSYSNVGDTFGAVDTSLTDLDGRVAGNSTSVTNLTKQYEALSAGTSGLVTFDASTSTVKVASAQAGSTVDFANSDGQARTLINVAAGTADGDAVNVSQLKGTAESVANALGGGSVVNADGTVSQPNYTVDGKTVNNFGDAITNIDERTTNIDNRTTANAAELSNLGTTVSDLSNGTAGLVTLDKTTGNVQVATVQGGSVVDMEGTDGKRRVSGVANGTEEDDVVTIAQLRAAGAIDPISGQTLSVLTYDGADLSRATLGGTHGTVLANVANGIIGTGSMEAINGGQLFDMKNALQGKIDGLDGRVGTIEKGIADGSLATGSGGNGAGNGSAGGTGGVEGGLVAPGAGEGAVAIGGGSAEGTGSISVGGGNSAGGNNSVGVGSGSSAGGNNSVSVGSGSSAGGTGSISVGEGSSAGGTGSVAIGKGASATNESSVAIGSGSTTSRDNEVSVGTVGAERVISNVAAGTQGTDAVNLQQMDDRFKAAQDWSNSRFQAVDKRIDRMGAISAAYAGMAINTAGLNGDNRLGAGVGSQNGRTALAVGYQRILGEKKNVSVSLGGAFSGSDQSVSAGAGFSW